MTLRYASPPSDAVEVFTVAEAYSYGKLTAGGPIPNPQRFVLADGDHAGAVAVEGYAFHIRFVPDEPANYFARLDVPQHYRIVTAAGGDRFSVRGQRRGQHVLGVALKCLEK